MRLRARCCWPVCSCVRGRLREAQAVLDRATDGLSLAGDSTRLVDIAIQKGLVSIELARVEDAETVLGAAIATAQSARDQDRCIRAASALARALFWRGKYDEAQSMGTLARSRRSR